MKRLLVAVVSLGALAAQANDYLSYKMLSNAAQPFPFYVDSRSSRPAGIDYTPMQNAVERAWATWNAVQCASVKVRSLGASVGTVPNPVQTTDAFSVAPVWMLSADADAIQIFGPSSLIAAISLPRAYAGVLQTCDVYFNAFQGSWSVDSVVPQGRMDVETVMLHEGGHCLGLDHSGPIESVMNQVVETGEAVRALWPTDVQLLCNRYPASGANGAPCLGDGGCLTAGEKCLAQPVTNGLTTSLCTNGCATGTNANCGLPLTCQPSTAFNGFNGACLLPGNIVTRVGAPCTDALTDCQNSFAVCRRPEAAPSGNNNFLWADGYCTQPCEVGQPVCPAGSTCVTLDVGKVCTQDCRVGLADCRPGYACAPIDSIGTSGVCIPRCYANQDCVQDVLGTTCSTCDGLCMRNRASPAQIGDGCTVDEDCGTGQSCRITDPRLPTIKQCTQQCARGCGLCPSGSTCTPGLTGELFCLKDCSGPGTCPSGLRCADTAVGKGCLPNCLNDTHCPVGEYCYLGECYPPTVDAGCGTLCTRPDAGKPVVVVPKDAGSGTGGTGGCGCTSADPLSLLAAFVAAAALLRRAQCRRS